MPCFANCRPCSRPGPAPASSAAPGSTRTPEGRPNEALLVPRLPTFALSGPLKDTSGASDRALGGALITDGDSGTTPIAAALEGAPRPRERDPRGRPEPAVARRASPSFHRLCDAGSVGPVA